MDYFTVDGVILRTGYKNKLDWYLLPIRELLDNTADFLWKYYSGSNASIRVKATINNKLLRLKIANSNERNIRVFSDIAFIFDYDMRYGSKQDVHIISRGMLGDAMKQILSLGYVLLHTNDDGTAFTDKQWEYPLIIRHNKEEWRIYLDVNKAAQTGRVKILKSPETVAYTDTEIELVLPVTEQVRKDLNRDYIEQFCRKYSILTTDISFKFDISDEIEKPTEDVDIVDIELEPSAPSGKIITVPALHPISARTNINSIHSYKPEEFVTRIMNLHDKSATSVYDVLITFREGSHIKKTEENKISVAELLSKADRDTRIEKLYRQLKEILAPSKVLFIPYTTNTKERVKTLVERISQIYDIDITKEPSYKILRGQYDDGIITYPYIFEILAIPFNEPTEKETKIICAVNYSVSPIGNNFEGNYEWHDKNGYSRSAKNIHEILEKHGFHTYHGPTAKLPCVVIANLVTPRRNPHGYDKSSIDTKPFQQTILTAVSRMVSGIQTFRAAGYRFQEADDYRTGRKHDINTKVNAKRLLEQFLIKERGLNKAE
jgi:hypothetical protein